MSWINCRKLYNIAFNVNHFLNGEYLMTEDQNTSKKEEIIKGKKVKKQNVNNFWSLKIFLLAVTLSLTFSIFSEFVMSSTGIVIAIIIILVFVLITIISDMIGVAVTSCSKEPFISMASKKVKGAKEGLMLIKNADKVASLCADVIGDVCGILSGAGGAAIALKITQNITNGNLAILITSLVTAFIAGLTICGKSLGKKTAIHNCNSIILKLGRFISLFTKKEKKLNKK